MTRQKYFFKPGDVVGLWTLLEECVKVDKGGKKRPYWLCRCSCEAEHEVDRVNLGSGKSSGCLECRNGNAEKSPSFRHGMSESSVYKRWTAMKERCKNPQCKAYPGYGGRGIEMAARWEDFDNFYADIGDPPTSRHSIERKDNNGNYEPDNCVWETTAAQSRNKRSTRFLTHKGRTMCMMDWANEAGMKYNTLQGRIDIQGLSVEDALTMPVAYRSPRKKK